VKQHPWRGALWRPLGISLVGQPVRECLRSVSLAVCVSRAPTIAKVQLWTDGFCIVEMRISPTRARSTKSSVSEWLGQWCAKCWRGWRSTGRGTHSGTASNGNWSETECLSFASVAKYLCCAGQPPGLKSVDLEIQFPTKSEYGNQFLAGLGPKVP
jgi:hypothetical protein